MGEYFLLQYSVKKARNKNLHRSTIKTHCICKDGSRDMKMLKLNRYRIVKGCYFSLLSFSLFSDFPTFVIIFIIPKHIFSKLYLNSPFNNMEFLILIFVSRMQNISCAMVLVNNEDDCQRSTSGDF